MSDILVINGHPQEGSLCDALVEAYAEGVRASGAGNVSVVKVRDLGFDLNLRVGLKEASKNMEPDLLEVQKQIARARHLVWVYPNWWGTMPALLKGFLDRTLVPGFAFSYVKGSPFVRQLLKGKTARALVTMDGPSWWYQHLMGAGGDRALVKSTLNFCGVKVRGVFHAHSLRGVYPSPAPKWLEKAREQGARDARTQAKV